MKYYLHTVPDDRGIHIVHREDCQYLPRKDHRRALGRAASCETALRRAAAHAGPVKGCHTCAPRCA